MKKAIGYSILAIFLVTIVIGAIWFMSFMYVNTKERFGESELIKVHSLSKTDAELNSDKYMQNSKIIDRYQYLWGLDAVAKRADCVYYKDGNSIEYILIQGKKGTYFIINFENDYLVKHVREFGRDYYIAVKTDSKDVLNEVIEEVYGPGEGLFI